MKTFHRPSVCRTLAAVEAFPHGMLLALLCLLALLAAPRPLFGASGEIPYVAQGPGVPSTAFVQKDASSPLLASSMEAADALHGMLAGRLNPGGPILPTSLVDLENLDNSSPLGRLVAQQIASRLGQYGYTVLDVRLRSNIHFGESEGEFLLSRDPKLLRPTYAAEAALVGTYSNTGGSLFVSVRVVRLIDSALLAAYEYSLPAIGGSTALLGGVTAWEEFGPRAQVFTGGTPGAPVWTDPGAAAQLKAIPAATRKR